MPRVNLRTYKDEDIAKLIRYLNDPVTTRHLTSAIPQPYTQSDAEYWVRHQSREIGAQAIEWEGQLVGDISVVTGNFEKAYCAEIGYWLGREFWGRGIATEVLTLVSQYLLTHTAVVRITAQVFVGNTASCRVLEKCGFIQEARLHQAAFKNGCHHDVLLYAKIKSINNS